MPENVRLEKFVIIMTRWMKIPFNENNNIFYKEFIFFSFYRQKKERKKKGKKRFGIG